MNKKLIKQEEYLVQFSEEEIESFGWEKCQKFSVEIKDEGVFLSPYKKLEIDISRFPREVLELLISKSCEQDVSINEVIEEMLDKVIDELNDSDT
jgi:predicted HicB family RNase H-like nuclease